MSKDNSSSSSSSLSSIRSSLTEEQKQELDDQLIEAAKIGDLETIKKLVQQGADVNYAGNRGRTALHWASESGYTETVQFLIENDANINAVVNGGATALHGASMFGHTATAQFLINIGANVHAVNNGGYTALHGASFSGHTTAAQLLIDNGANVNAVDNMGQTALNEASKYGKSATATLLLQNGANVYLANQDLREISELVSPLLQAHDDLEDICLSDDNNTGEAVLDGKINRIKSELLVNYPNLINSPLDEEGNTILNLIANKIVSQEEGKEKDKEKDDLLRFFVKLALINSSEFKRNVTANIIATNDVAIKDLAKIIADYSTDNKKGAITPIDVMLVINDSLKRKNLNLDINKKILGYFNENERDQNLIQAFILAEKKNYWQDALTHSQSSSPYLGQNTAGGSASSSSSSSFTADSSNNAANATNRSGKDEKKYPDDASLSSSPSSSPFNPEVNGSKGIGKER